VHFAGKITGEGTLFDVGVEIPLVGIGGF